MALKFTTVPAEKVSFTRSSAGRPRGISDEDSKQISDALRETHKSGTAMRVTIDHTGEEGKRRDGTSTGEDRAVGSFVNSLRTVAATLDLGVNVKREVSDNGKQTVVTFAGKEVTRRTRKITLPKPSPQTLIPAARN